MKEVAAPRYLPDAGTSSGDLGIDAEHSRNLENEGWGDFVLVCPELGQVSLIHPSQVIFFFVKEEVMTSSASSGSLGLREVAAKIKIGKGFDKNKLCKCDGWVLW